MSKHRLPWEALPEPDPTTMAGRLVMLRRDNRLSQREFAKQLGVSPQNISLWETGQHNPSMKRLEQIAKLFGIPLQELAAATTVSQAVKSVRNLQQDLDIVADGVAGPETVDAARKYSAPIHECDAYVTARENICIMRVNDTDALEPWCKARDYLLVDTSDKQPSRTPQWYTLSDRFVLLVRQVAMISEMHYRLTTPKDAVAREVSSAEVTILGRVIGKVQMF
jgi:transcriptional regulator with XRE-family HTH domain